MRRLVYLLVLLAAAAALAWAFLPKPVPVDVAPVVRGPLVVTVDAEGRTRIRERYVVAAPVAGRLHRLPVKAGDAVVAGRTTLARLDPEEAPLLDERTRRTAEMRLAATEDARQQALASAERAKAAETLAATNVARVKQLLEGRTVSRQEYDEAEAQAQIASSERRAADFAVKVAEHEVEMARITLECCAPEGPGGSRPATVSLAAPVTGVVLKVFQESATVVAPGTALVEVGDARDLEVEVDVLSTDAVRIPPGAPATLERWGGPAPLSARVRRVEPAAFLKVSALGVEEQRVWVLLDLLEPPEAWAALGDGYRVEARIVTWQAADTVKVPAGALFREGEGWAAYVREGDRARLRVLRLGPQNGLEAEVLEGLSAGDLVILHPGDRVEDGVKVTAR